MIYFYYFLKAFTTSISVIVMAQLEIVKSISSFKSSRNVFFQGLNTAMFFTERTTVGMLRFAPAAVALINMSMNQCRR